MDNNQEARISPAEQVQPPPTEQAAVPSAPEIQSTSAEQATIPSVDQVPLPPMEVDPETDNDSTLGEDQSTYTETLRSSLLESTRENGRGYHKYRDGHYILPEDEYEQERLDMQHEMFLRTINHRLILAPIQDPVLNALDLGTGTGIWAIDYADQHPETQVLGIDLSPIQPTYLPPNCKFEVDDFDNEWTFAHKFDLIHGRMLVTSSTDFQKIFKQAYDNLNPGGWLEMQDLSLPFQSDDGTMKGTHMQEWHDNFILACSLIGRDATWTWEYKKFMIEAGFENVEEHIYRWPIGPWAKDKFLKEMGAWNLVNNLDGLEAFTSRLFTKVLGKPMEEVQVIMAEVRKDLQSKKIHADWPIHFVYGQKPAK